MITGEGGGELDVENLVLAVELDDYTGSGRYPATVMIVWRGARTSSSPQPAFELSHSDCTAEIGINTLSGSVICDSAAPEITASWTGRGVPFE